MLPTTPLPEPETGTPEAEVPGVTVQYGTLVSRSGTEGRQGVWEGHWAMETPYTACFMGSTRGGAQMKVQSGVLPSARKRGVLSPPT